MKCCDVLWLVMTFCWSVQDNDATLEYVNQLSGMHTHQILRKHAEQASHQVEDGLNAMLATEVCLAGAHAVAKANSL